MDQRTMIDRGKLEAAISLYRDRAFVVLELSPELATIVEAAETHLAQLPEKCGTCVGVGIACRLDPPVVLKHNHLDACTCPSCHGTGTVYPPALVERIAFAIGGITHEATRMEYITGADYKRWAVAVLDALNTETP